ncbi:MAG: hypothetical protein FJZ92_13895 [Chloroflexi bacterium]|nr:hypothetical protein [Chloroflexota bacterium]
MNDACKLWVSLSSGRRHRESTPDTFLRFVRTGLLVGLPDEPGGLLREGQAMPQLPMRRVDAEGLA